MNHALTYLDGVGMTCAAGDGSGEIMANLRQGSSPGMIMSDRWTPGTAVMLGQVTVGLPALAAFPHEHHTRNNQLALHSSRQITAEIHDAISRYGAQRVGVVIGTTTSGMSEAETAFLSMHRSGSFPDSFAYAHMEIGSSAEFLALAWGLGGPAYTISTACSSSAKAMAAGRRLLRLGVCDAVLVGGVDTLCTFTILGFSALGALSPRRSLPFSPNRAGINIGEAAAFFMMRRDRGPVVLLGIGETSDAYKISAPQPHGDQAQAAMAQALREAGVRPDQIGYVNLHGTGTRQNDAMEAIALAGLFPGGVACSSTKPLTGHTLGAAGALEIGICYALVNGTGRTILPPHLNDGITDPELARLNLVTAEHMLERPPRYVLSNVFGFGGTNVSLLVGAA